MRSFFGKFPPQHFADFFVECDDEHIFPPVVQWNMATLENILNFDGTDCVVHQKNIWGEFVRLKNTPKNGSPFYQHMGVLLKYFQIYSRPMCFFFNAWLNPHSVGGSEVFHDCWILLVRVTTISTTPFVGFSRGILPTVISHWNPEGVSHPTYPISLLPLGRFLPAFSLAHGFWPWHGGYIAKKTCPNSTFCSLNSLGNTICHASFSLMKTIIVVFFTVSQSSHNLFKRKRTSRINSIGS